METFSLDKVRAAIILDTRRERKRKRKKTGDYPIRYRVTFNRDSVYYPCMDMSLKDWEALPTARGKELVKTRVIVQSGFETIKNHIKEMVQGEGFSLAGLNQRLNRGSKNSITVAFENKILQLTKAGQIGTASSYQCAINSIQKFITEDLKISDITIDWLRRYESHLLTEGKTRTTIKFYIGCIRALMNEARQNKMITEGAYPFGKGKFEIKTGQGRKLALTLLQIKAVLDHPLNTDYEKRSRDLWFFSYLTNGINFNDMLRLKYKDIAGGEIHFHRQKTIRTTRNQKEIAATLLPEMKDIIVKWGNSDKKPDSYIFPFLTKEMDAATTKRIIQNVIRLCNKKMKEISDALNYDTISTYTARHSYASVLKRSGSNIAFISESLGHSDLRTTENYLASFEQDERAKNAAKLTNFKSTPKRHDKK